MSAIGQQIHQYWYYEIDPFMILGRVRQVAEEFGLDVVEETVTRMMYLVS